MRAVVQRVSEAWVRVGADEVGRIGPGLLVLLGVGRQDVEADADQLAEKVVRKQMSATRAIERAQQRLDRAAEQLTALEVWTRKLPTSRKPRFTREELAEAWGIRE